MIVGDTNQLPPSNFFRKMVDDDDADEDETVLNESILEMANATFPAVTAAAVALSLPAFRH